MPEGKIIVNTLNGILFILLEKANQNSILRVLIAKLKTYCFNSNNNNNENENKISILISKCIIKISDVIKSLHSQGLFSFENILESLILLSNVVEKKCPDLNTTSTIIEDLCVKIIKQIIYEIVKLCYLENSDRLNFDILVGIYTKLKLTKNLEDKSILKLMTLAYKTITKPNSEKSLKSNVDVIVDNRISDKSTIVILNNQLKDDSINIIEGKNQINNLIEKISNAITKSEKIQFILELFSEMKILNINKLDSIVSDTRLSKEDIMNIKKEWILIKDKNQKNNTNEFNKKLNSVDINSNSSFNKVGDSVLNSVQTNFSEENDPSLINKINTSSFKINSVKEVKSVDGYIKKLEKIKAVRESIATHVILFYLGGFK